MSSRRALAVAAIVVLTAVVASSARAQVSGAPPGTFSGCPHDTQALPGPLRSFERPVRIAVLQFVRTSFRTFARTPPSLLDGARVRSVWLVRDWLPSGWIRSECRIAVWRNSVAVDVYFPRLDRPHNPVGRCSDCAHVTFLATSTRGGWTVWGRR
jgi:hypothetical protein